MPRVLLIQSDKVYAGLLGQAFSKSGYAVDWAIEPQDAIDLADQHTPDIVVCDLLLAKRSGIEFLYEFVSYPDWSNIPIILLSSVPESEVNVSGVGYSELNVRKFLYKPQTSLAQVVEYARSSIKVSS